MANPQVSTIIGLARDLMREEIGSDVPAIADAFMIIAVSDADKELIRAFRKGNGNSPNSQASETGFNLVSETTINDVNGVTPVSTSITVEAQTFPDAAGAAVIWDKDMFDIFYYNSQTSTLFSGVTGISFNHNDNTAIQALYKLPSNFKNFRKSEEYGDGVMLNGAPLTYMDGPPDPGKFSYIDDGTNKYLWLYRGASGAASTIYDKTSLTIDSADDFVSFDEEYQFFYVWRCIELSLFGRGDYPLVGLAKTKGDWYKLDALKDRNVGKRVRVRQIGSIGDRNYERLAISENAL